MNHTEPGRLLSDIINETFQLNGAIISAGDRLVADLGLTSARWQVLSVIIDSPATVSDISRRMGLSRQNVQRIVNRLVKDGFIATADNPDHLKARLCSLSPLGKTTMAEVRRRQVDWANGISQSMDRETLHKLAREMMLLRKAITRTRA